MKHTLISQYSTELKAIFFGYPRFIFARNNFQILNGIPVFVYHTIDPALFESHLKYLKKNNYKTLTIYDFYDLIVKNKPSDDKKLVLLTIDDARSSVWRYAYPLLAKYQMHATVFVIPGVTETTDKCRINLNNYWNGNCSLEDINKIDPNDNLLCSWNEIKEMYFSGFVNIESHTLFHKEVFINTSVVDFIEPGTPFLKYNFIGSPYYKIENIQKQPVLSDFIGLPVFESAPLMLGGPKLEVTGNFISACKEIFNQSTKQKIDWKQRIIDFIKKESANDSFFRRFENSINDVYTDLKLSRKEIQEHLDNKAGNHLCLPWTKGSDATIKVCKELDIKSCFWGVLDNKKINKIGDDPYFITRIKNDFIFRLPGNGRRSLLSIYKYKMQRRLSGEKIF